MLVNDLRKLFLDYFASKNHKILTSAPLIPHNDPSLMFVNAGMVQFKNIFTGVEKGRYKTVTTSQKCVRAGGKHNDLENVGYTARHHTFFEMLGNFSFGDYFKEDAIKYAWEFVTEKLKLPKDKLIVTIYHTDDEAFKLWQKIAGLSEDRIVRIATNDNFWSMGDTGPCGPCSEIFYDHGEEYEGCKPGDGDEGDRYIEIWNLVFMQYEKLKDGSMIDLPNPCIDTGMGLERVAAIMQGQQNNYDIDLFTKLVDASAKLTGDVDKKHLVSHRVIADHLRSISFLIADGVLPSNEGRGYVLRRIMRRAMRHVHNLGYKKPLLTKLFPTLLELMGGHYKELQEAKELICTTINNEEERFGKTLDKGLKILDEEILSLKNKNVLSGDIAFKLYDTYGFPLDLTEDILRSKEISVDRKKFDVLMHEQKERAKANWQGSGEAADSDIWFNLKDNLGETKFIGYDNSTCEAEVLAIIADGKELDEANEVGSKYQIICDQTVFYAESGGQVGDVGIIKSEDAEFIVTDTKKRADKLFVHFVKLIKGSFKLEDKVVLEINREKRLKIRANHSATHLLHRALHEVVGKHAVQKGSYVSDEILRFDFTNNKGLTADEIKSLEMKVNNIIRSNDSVTTDLLTIDEAKKRGALALFGEKYDSKVRMLSMGEWEGECYSRELCGGTHVNRLGDIGLVKIISEGSIASGIRRIEALTGEAAFNYLSGCEENISQMASLMKVPAKDVVNNVTTLLEEKKSLNKKLSELNKKLAANDSNRIEESINGMNFIVVENDNINAKEARELVLEMQKNEQAIILFFVVDGAKVAVIVAVHDEFTKELSAVKLLQEAVLVVGGKGGGGKDNFAQGGGNKPEAIKDAIGSVRKLIENCKK